MPAQYRFATVEEQVVELWSATLVETNRKVESKKVTCCPITCTG
jgi:hypothetical protein